jgi:uncharacterized protein
VRVEVEALVEGTGAGPVQALTEPLSFWGGVDPATGTIVDRRHPEAGRSLAGTITVMAGSRGSSSASSVLAEMIRRGTAPAGLVLSRRDPVLVLGAVVADELYDASFPVALLERGEGLAALRRASHAELVLDDCRTSVEIVVPDFPG